MPKISVTIPVYNGGRGGYIRPQGSIALLGVSEEPVPVNTRNFEEDSMNDFKTVMKWEI